MIMLPTLTDTYERFLADSASVDHLSWRTVGAYRYELALAVADARWLLSDDLCSAAILRPRRSALEEELRASSKWGLFVATSGDFVLAIDTAVSQERPPAALAPEQPPTEGATRSVEGRLGEVHPASEPVDRGGHPPISPSREV